MPMRHLFETVVATSGTRHSEMYRHSERVTPHATQLGTWSTKSIWIDLNARTRSLSWTANSLLKDLRNEKSRPKAAFKLLYQQLAKAS